MPRTVIWASCGLNSDHPVYAAFDELGRRLKQRDISLFLFVNSPMAQTWGGFHSVTVPFSSLYFPVLRSLGVHDLSICPELLAIERAWATPDTVIENHTIENAVGLWEAVADLTAPCAILSWHTTPPLSHLHRRIAERRRIPWWSLELGPLPETLDLSPGQVHRSSLNTAPSLRKGNFTDAELDSRIARLRSYYGALAERHYPANNKAVSDERSWELLDPAGKKILFVGSFDVACGAGLSPPHAAPGAGERCSSYVGSSQAALNHLAHALARISPSAIVWVRPHPGHALSMEVFARVGVRAELTDTEDLPWLIQHVDVAACIASNAQLQLALWGTPQISFAAGYLTGRNVAYDARTPEELDGAVMRALSGEEWQERERRGKEVMVLLFDRQLIGMQPHTPTSLRMADLADLLAGFHEFSEPMERDHVVLAEKTTLLLGQGFI